MSTTFVTTWDIWEADWRHEDGTRKPRPVLVLSPTAAYEGDELISVVKIQTARGRRGAWIELDDTASWFAATGLRHTCHVRVLPVRKLPASRLLYFRGFAPDVVASEWLRLVTPR